MSAIINLFYLYDPWLMHFIRMAFVAGGVALLYLLYQWKQKNISDFYFPKTSFAVILGLILCSSLPLILHGTTDFSVLKMYAKTLILFSFGVMIYNAFYVNQPHKMVQDLKWGIIIQFIIGLLALSDISIFIDMALGTNSSVILPRFAHSEQAYRLYNLTSSAFFQLSAFYLILLHFLLAYNEKHNHIHGIYLFLLLVIGLISGRTFFMLSIFSILLYFKWRYLPYLIAFALLVIGLAIFMPEHRYVAHALEPIINLISGAKQISSSTDTLVQKHLFMPNLKQILIGDGYYYTADFHYYGGSDSGFIRQALYGGIGYILVCFLFTAYFVKQIADDWFNGSWKFVLSTLLILSLLNIKADTYAYPGIMLVLLMFLSLFTDKKMKNSVKTKEENNV